MSSYTIQDIIAALAAAAAELDERKEEVNKLNVFPVPDGDTGTNMALTVKSVVSNVANLPVNPSVQELAKAITSGALMGARGNSGVITSQILRGMCEGVLKAKAFDATGIDAALSRSKEVAFQAVRKPVRGTILTVVEDVAAAARKAKRKKLSTEDALNAIVEEAYASVKRTPDLLPVLKENGVVDSGAFGLAILFDTFVATLTGSRAVSPEVMAAVTPDAKVEIEQIHDWEGSEYRYCTEFLVLSEDIDIDATKEFLPTMGDCDLMVGVHPNFKVHVHSNRPDQVLQYFLEHDAQISEVHVHNMDIQSVERVEKIEAEAAQRNEKANTPKKPLGIVAVAPGSGNAKILESLGVDVVISGGQTMNPSTADILEAITNAHAESVIILPNNKNIIMAAQAATEVSEIPSAVVPTASVPQAFSALFGFNDQLGLEENVAAMGEAFEDTKTGEVTRAVKDSKDAHDNPIHDGDVIGIADGSIEVVGSDYIEVVLGLCEAMGADDADTATILAGEDFSDADLDTLVHRIEEAYDDLEIDVHRGEQPLYPVIFSLE